MAKSKSRYGDYCEVIAGELYGSINLPLGNGKYKKKRKKVASKTEARQWALEQLERHKQGEIPSKKNLTFADLADWYRKEFLIPPVYKNGMKLEGQRSYKSQLSRLKLVSDYFNPFPLTNITVDVLRRYKRERLKTVSITSTNRDFALLRTMFGKAYRRKWIKENPFDHGENLIEIALERHRESPITTQIAKRLLARSRKSDQPLLHYVILVMMNTGARPSEVFPFDAYDDVIREPLTWNSVLEYDFKRIRLVSYKGRIKRERVLPTTRTLEIGLKRLYTQIDPYPDDLMFPVKNFKRSWKTLCKSVGVSGVWLRDFRKYYNSLLVRNPNINDMERMILMGHEEMSTNRRYSQLGPEFDVKYRNVIESDSVN